MSQPSQQEKEGRDEGVSTNSNVTLSNHVRRWMGQVEVSSLLDRERATMAIFGLATNLTLFFSGMSQFFLVVSYKNQFF